MMNQEDADKLLIETCATVRVLDERSKHMNDKVELNYKNLDRKIEGSLQSLSDKIQEVIELQKITNGRVSNNEGRVTTLENWRSRNSGIWYAVVIMGTVFGGLMGLAVSYFFGA